jgi:hypothetical protein
MLRSFFPLLGMLLLAQPLQAQDDERSQADYEDKPGFGGPESRRAGKRNRAAQTR